MTLNLLNHIHYLLLTDAKAAKKNRDDKARAFNAYETQYLTGEGVTNEITLRHLEDELDKANRKLLEAKNYLEDFENETF